MTMPTANALVPSGPFVRRGALTGTGALIRHILRRDRVRLTIWILMVPAFASSVGYAYQHMYDDASLAAQAAVMRTPTGIVLAGPGYGLDDYTPAAATANELTLWLVMALALLGILHVVRHTRAEEETGRLELVTAQPVGRHAPATAAIATLTVALLLVGLLGTAALSALDGFPAADAAAMMTGSAAAGLAFGAVALVTAQVTTSARAATGLALVVLVAAFVVRAAGDVAELHGSALSWFSPVAWAQQTRAFVDVRWWPVALPVALVVALIAASAALAARRDLGAGLLAARSGPARGRIGSPAALAWRQQRGALGWTALGFAVMLFATGTMMTSISDTMTDIVSDNPAFAAMFGEDPAGFESAFLDVILMFTATGVAAYAIAAVARVSSEESSGRLELLLALPVSRARWFGAQVLAAGAGAVLVLAIAVAALWAGCAAVGMTDPGGADFGRAIAFHAAAVLVFCSVGAALVAALPRALGIAWALLAVAFLFDMFGPLFDLPDATLAASPFRAASGALSADADPVPVTICAAVAAVLFAAASIAFRRRDLRAG